MAERFNVESLRFRPNADSRSSNTHLVRGLRPNDAPRAPGVWIPQEVVDALVRFPIRPASRSQVFVLVLCQWCRYGQRVAILTVGQIAARTGLSLRTAQAAIRDLIGWGLIRREGRYGKLVVVAEALERRLESGRSSRGTEEGSRDPSRGLIGACPDGDGQPAETDVPSAPAVAQKRRPLPFVARCSRAASLRPR